MAETTTSDVLPLLQVLALLALAGRYDNHLWRMILLVAQYVFLGGGLSGSGPFLWALYALVGAGIWWMPHSANRRPRLKRGCVFVTGCDSGMGKETVLGLARAQCRKSRSGQDDDEPSSNSSSNNPDGYDQIFAGCYDPKHARAVYEKELSEKELACVTLVALDVTDQDSVREAAHKVREWIYEHRQKKAAPGETVVGLSALVQFHGVAFNGPSEYMPIEMYTRQLDVNFVGTIRVVQALLPLLKESSGGGNGYRSRIVLTGTGGGPCSPCPPLLTAYMSSKFALEAYAQALRQELYMIGSSIDVGVINPGFVKPTMLIAEGTKISEGMWRSCATRLGSNRARDEYGAMLNHFTEYSALQPGTHVSKIVEATEHALLSPVPRSSYKVGIDSKLAPIVGMMPTGVREWIARHGIYGKLSPAGTVPGYRV